MNKRIYKDQTSDEGEIPFYKIGSFGKQADAFISRKLFNEYKKLYPFPKKGDILISASGSIGRTIVYNGEDAYFQDSNIIWIQHDNRLDNTFLHQLFNIIRWSGVEGTTIKRLYNKNILSTQILLPSVEEQRSIGSLLDNVDNLIAATQDKIDALEQAKKALLQRLFDQSWRFKDYSDPWEKRKLGELAKVRTGKAFKSSSFSPNGKYYVVTNKDIGGPQISTHMDGDRIDITNPVDIAKYSLSGRNLLVTMDGVNIGKTAMYSNEDAVLAQRVGRLTSSSLDFVHQITSQKNFLTRMNELSVGNAIKHISLKQISDYAVNVPQQTSERQLIGQTLSLLDNLIAATQSRLSSLELLKKSLLQDLFI